MPGEKLRKAEREGAPGPLDAVECPSSFLRTCRVGRAEGLAARSPRGTSGRWGCSSGLRGRPGRQEQRPASALERWLLRPACSVPLGPALQVDLADPGLISRASHFPRAPGRDNSLPLEQVQFPL